MVTMMKTMLMKLMMTMLNIDMALGETLFSLSLYMQEDRC